MEFGVSSPYFGAIIEVLNTSLDRVHFDVKFVAYHRIHVAYEFLGVARTPNGPRTG